MSDIKNDVLMKLNVLMGTLNNVNVHGEQDCDNISGSIKMLRDIGNLLNRCNIEKIEEERKPASAKRLAKEE